MRPPLHLLLLLPVLAWAGTPDPARVTASSTAPRAEDTSYSATNLTDGRAGTFWMEGERASGLGTSIVFELGAARPVHGLRIWNGNGYSGDLWARYNRMKDIEITLGDGTRLPFQLKDGQAPETVAFTAPVTTSTVKLTFKSVYKGNTYGDTCVSEIQVLDALPEGRLTAVVSASSVFPADVDASYGPENLGDGLVDTLWCEGVKGADGTGQWLAFDFGGVKTVSRLRVFNGNAFDAAENAKANQVASLELAFGDGTTKTLPLAASAELQECVAEMNFSE